MSHLNNVLNGIIAKIPRLFSSNIHLTNKTPEPTLLFDIYHRKSRRRKMKKMTKNCLSALLVISVSGLYGCGGSSGGGSGSDSGGDSEFNGSTESASIDADNAQVIGEAAGEAV